MRKGVMRIFLMLLACILVLSSCGNGNDGGQKDEGKQEKRLEIGETVTLGRYEQDGDESNGPEPIEWVVLDVQDGKALLLSKYGLDAKPYNTEETEISWETCTLRAWLNGDFLNTVFSEKEQSGIVLTNVDNGKAQGYNGNTDGGNNTWDKVFLLSWAEAERYLDTAGASGKVYAKALAAPTAFARLNGAGTSGVNITADGEAVALWWLRSNVRNLKIAGFVNIDGSLSNCSVKYDHVCVRPALWLDLESDF